MSEFLTQSYAQRQASLEQAKAAFLAKGGVIEVIAGFVYKPMPDLAPRGSASRVLELAPEQALPAPDVEHVKGLAASHTIRDVIKLTGLRRGELRSMAQRHGFKFASGKRQMAEWTLNRCVDRDQDARDVERLKAFAQIGVTRSQAAKQIGYSLCKVTRLITQFDIDFPPGGKAVT